MKTIEIRAEKGLVIVNCYGGPGVKAIGEHPIETRFRVSKGRKAFLFWIDFGDVGHQMNCPFNMSACGRKQWLRADWEASSEMKKERAMMRFHVPDGTEMEVVG